MKKKYIIGLLLLLGLGLISCQGKTTYTSEDLGITLKLPSHWQDSYWVSQEEDSLEFYYGSEPEKDRPLFSLKRELGELISQEDLHWQGLDGEVVKRTRGYSFIFTYPKERENQEASQKVAYEKMLGDLYDIKNSLRILDSLPAPRVKNKGYKHFATSFFSLELGPGFSLKKSKKNPFIWNIINRQKRDVGDIELVAYKQVTMDEAGMLTQYREDPGLGRRFRISLKDQYSLVYKNLVDSFSIRPGPRVSLDEIYRLEEILKDSGRKISGSIEAISFEEGNIVSLTIKTQSGLEAYRQVMGNIVASRDGNYYLYNVYPINQASILSDGEYREKTYDFILDKQGVIRGMVEGAESG